MASILIEYSQKRALNPKNREYKMQPLTEYARPGCIQVELPELCFHQLERMRRNG